MKILNIVDSAYRGTLEEQDDQVVWLVHALRGAGAGADVLLSGNAVNYAVRGQRAAGLVLGDWTQRHPPDLERDLTSLVAKGGAVYLLEDDAEARGLSEEGMVEGIRRLRRAALPRLLAEYDHVWHW